MGFKTKFGTWKYDVSNNSVIKVIYPEGESETYTGTYENALSYFGISPKLKDEYELEIACLNIVSYYQLDEKTFTRLTNEIYRMLLDAFSSKRYYVEPSLRHDMAIRILNICKDKNLIFDEEIIKYSESQDKKKFQDRVFHYRNFTKKEGEELEWLYLK